MKYDDLVDELTDSLINGNRTYVIAEINKMPGISEFISVKIYAKLCSLDMKDVAGGFLFALWDNTPE